MIGRVRREAPRDLERGQSLVEFSLIVVVFLLMLTSMLEFGFVFDTHMTLETSTREGARVGSAISNGGGGAGCAGTLVDRQIIAAVERVLTSPGSRVDLSQVTQIRIYKVKLITGGVTDTTGNQDGTSANIWNYNLGGGPTVDGAPLNFSQTSAAWDSCTRLSGAAPDSIGVSLSYTYQMITPIAGRAQLLRRRSGPDPDHGSHRDGDESFELRNMKTSDRSNRHTSARRQRGQVIVIFAVAFLIFLGMSAIVIDLAWYWSSTIRMQRAADAAALAGVVRLPGDEAGAQTLANTEASRNGYTSNVNGVTVNPRRRTLRTLGKSSYRSTARSARSSPAPSGSTRSMPR